MFFQALRELVLIVSKLIFFFTVYPLQKHISVGIFPLFTFVRVVKKKDIRIM